MGTPHGTSRARDPGQHGSEEPLWQARLMAQARPEIQVSTADKSPAGRHA